MANRGRPLKKSLSFSQWDTDMFDDNDKIFTLLQTQGWKGFGLFFFLCQKIYGTDGYYMRWCSPTSACRMAQLAGGGAGAGSIQEIINVCLRIGLFDKGLYDRLHILTSCEIQRRFASAIRDCKDTTVIGEYWLLDDAENAKICPRLSKVALKSNLSAEKSNLSAEKSIEEEGEEEKEKDTLLHSACVRERLGGTLGRGLVMLSEVQVNKLLDLLSLDEFNYYVGVIADAEEKGMHYRKKTHFQAILDMAEQDRCTSRKRYKQ